jgi:TRAP transporter TAXI family solute receptor
MALPAGRALARMTAPSALIMGTGRPGGYYALYGAKWGELAQSAAGIDIAFRASGGAAADILLIEQNTTQLGMTTLVVAEQARNGVGAWTAGVKFQEFRALFPMFPSVLQIISPRPTGITTLAGLAGQVVGIGPDGSTGATAVPSILASVGVLPKASMTGDYVSQVQDMLAGRIAACAFIGAPPLPAIAAAAMGRKLSLIGFSEDEARQVARTSPGMTSMLLVAGVLPGLTTAVGSVGTVNFAIGAASLPDAQVSALTLAALRNQPALAALVPAAGAAPDAGPIMRAGIPFHPGAAAALRSLGLDIPDEAVQG